MIRKPLQHEIDWSDPIKHEAGLVNWWPMVGWRGSLIARDMMRRNHATLTNMVPSSDWIYDGVLRGMTLDFDGSNDYLYPNVGGLFGHLGSGNLSISLWVMTRSAATRQCIIGDWSSAATNSSFTIEIGGFGQTAGRLTCSNAGASTYNYVDSGITATNGQWYQVGIVYDVTTRTRRIYVNGVYRAQATLAEASAAGVNLTFGRGGDFNSLYLNGRIADIRFYNRVLGDGEMYRLWHPQTRWTTLNVTPTTPYGDDIELPDILPDWVNMSRNRRYISKVSSHANPLNRFGLMGRRIRSHRHTSKD